MDVLPRDAQFIGRDGGQAAADNDGLRAAALGLAHELAALGRGGVGDATGIDDDEVRAGGDIDVNEAATLDKFANLLTLVLVNFTAEG